MGINEKRDIIEKIVLEAKDKLMAEGIEATYTGNPLRLAFFDTKEFDAAEEKSSVPVITLEFNRVEIPVGKRRKQE